MEAHGAQILPGCPRTDGPRAMVSRTRSWAVATIISRITVNAVTQILPVANENYNNNNNKTFTIYRDATSSQLKIKMKTRKLKEKQMKKQTQQKKEQKK